MFHKITLFAALLVTGLSAARAQTPKTGRFHIKAGAQLAYGSDRLASPLIYRSLAYGGGFGYEKQFPKWMLAVSFEGLYGSQRSVSHPQRSVIFRGQKFTGERDSFSFDIKETLIDLRLSVDLAAKPVDKGIHRLYLGGTLTNRMHYNTGFTNFALGNYAYAGLFLRYALDPSPKHGIYWEASLPLLVYSNRLPWNGSVSTPYAGQAEAFFKAGGGLYSLNKFMLLQSAVNYRYQVTPLVAVGAEWTFYWLSVREPLPHKFYANGLHFKTSFTL